MILLTSVAAGMLTGWACARWQGRSWRPPLFRATLLVVLGFLPQLFAFYLPFTRQLFPNWLASVSLVLSQLMLLSFALLNWRLPFMILLTIGLGCNLTVILVNGGFMPLPVETASRLVSASVLSALEVGGRIGSASKDILLPEARITLPLLADRFVPPAFFPYRFAFSLGDVFIGLGAFGLLARGQPTVTRPS